MSLVTQIFLSDLRDMIMLTVTAAVKNASPPIPYCGYIQPLIKSKYNLKNEDNPKNDKLNPPWKTKSFMGQNFFRIKIFSLPIYFDILFYFLSFYPNPFLHDFFLTRNTFWPRHFCSKLILCRVVSVVWGLR